EVAGLERGVELGVDLVHVGTVHGTAHGRELPGSARPSAAAWFVLRPAAGPSGRAARMAAATRTASAFGRTRWTRTHHAPAAATRAVTATVASSHSTNGRGVPSGAARSLVRNPLREAPTRTGYPVRVKTSRCASRDQLCPASGLLANPSPGSSTI